MKGLFKLIVVALSIFLLLAFFGKNSLADTKIYTITATPISEPYNFVSVFLQKDFDINYQSGEIFLGSNPDGTGITQVDDGVRVTVTRPDSTIDEFGDNYAAYCGAAIFSHNAKDLTYLFQPGLNHVHVALYDLCGGMIGTTPLYLVNTNAPDQNPSPSPTPNPQPFLDLPWDYQNKGLTFNEAAQSINSYFDHEYPLLSSSLSEPSINQNQVTIYKGENSTVKPYSSHDGYDYGKPAQVAIGDSVLAAGDGCATYSSSIAGGNMIKIDHNNGYQSRYLHLQRNGLLTLSPSECTKVTKGQQIGKVGATGNVSPKGDAGAHIHFMVIQDKNKDGNFEDNIPDGITDPFGWQSSEQDPWPSYSFFYNGQQRTGNTSSYLWTKPIANLSDQLTANGGFFQLERYKLNFPQGATQENLNLQINSSPLVKVSNILKSIGSTIVVTAKNIADFEIKSFFQPFTISIDFSGFDISLFKPETISIYSSPDGTNWTKEQTTVDFAQKSATTQVNHLTYFALMGERVDIQAPSTTANLSGDKGSNNWYRSQVQFTLNAQDNEGGLGIDYTLYKINDGDWEQYSAPVNFTNEGNYKVDYYSVDKDENIEDVKNIEFSIDETAPEAKVFIDLTKLDLVVEGVDANQTVVEKIDNDKTRKKNDAYYSITDLAGNTLKLGVIDFDKKKLDRFKINSLQYNDATELVEPINHINVIFQGKNDALNVREQNFEIKGDVKIRIKFDPKTRVSTIITKLFGQEKVKETKDGLILLHLVTNQGNLEYSY